MKHAYRRQVRPSDRDAVSEITSSTGFFNPEEVLVAVELVDENLQKGSCSGYNFLFYEDENGAVLGYTCYGQVPGTKESFDLYWIVVDRRSQCRGIGHKLLARTEKDIVRMGGSRIYVETSSRDLYRHTRAFYSGSGYVQEAMLKDFYAPGDGKIIYLKVIFKAPF